MGGEWLLEPADAVGIEPRHGLARIGHGVTGIGVREDDHLVAEGLAHRGDALEIPRRSIAHAELERLVALGDEYARFLDERRRLLIAERDASRVRGNGTRGAA